MIGSIHIVTGARGSGKTSLMLALATWASGNGIQVAGIISPGYYDSDGKKLGLCVRDVTSGQEMELAVRDSGTTGKIRTPAYSFNVKTIKWADKRLERSVPCELFMVDEIGPLEFHEGKGWSKVFKILKQGRFGSAVIVIRIELLNEASKLWPQARVWQLNGPAFIARSIKAISSVVLREVQSWRRTNRMK
jgi:nucleoside-triphosphatase THEP1